jgi:NitT/TauT family transport system substrate-binding protein
MLRHLAAYALLLASAAFAHSEETRVVHVGITNLSSDIGLYLADKRGYFEQEGLKVELLPFDAGAKMVASLGTGDLDVGAGAASAGLYNAVNSGLKLKIVADKGTNIANYSYKALTIRKDLADAGAFKSLADLKGKTVAVVAKGAADESVIHQALLKGGLSDESIDLVYLPFAQHMAAFANHAIDAAISSEPMITLMERNGVARRFVGLDDFYPVQQTSMLIMNGPFVADREQALKFLRAYLRGVRDYTATLHDGKIAGPGAEKMIEDISGMTGIKDRSLIAAAIPVFINPNGDMSMESLQTDLAFFKSKGLVKPEVDLDQAIDVSLIADVKAALGTAPLPR